MMYRNIYVRDVLDDVYKEFGKNMYCRDVANDPNPCGSLETRSKRRAWKKLQEDDPKKIENMVKKVCEKTHLKEDAALSLLMRLGIFLKACEKVNKR